MSFALVYALHGFLGQSSDWDDVKTQLSRLATGPVSFNSEDLFTNDNQGVMDFYKQSEFLINKIRSLHSYNGKRIFLGYSLGGRIGLHLLKLAPDLFDHYIFLSTNPGLSESASAERKARLLNDQKWSEKIKEENWDHLLNEWNSQPIFNGSGAEPKRDVKKYDLDKLKESLLKWSLGAQEDFSAVIQKHRDVITWVVGDQDKKYCEIAEQLKEKYILLDYKKIKAGHRAWCDNPAAVAEIISKVI